MDHLSRRNVLKFLGAGGVVAAGGLFVSSVPAQARTVKTSAKGVHIVIVGAGAAGLSTASRLSNALDGAKLTIIDKQEFHHYQPGFTLIAAGLKPAGYVVSKTEDYLPRDINWIRESVAEVDPDADRVITESGKIISYDYLVVATGLSLDYAAIEGMETNRIGKDGLGSIYAGPEAAAATWQAMSAFAERGGIGVFGRPNTEMKCAGAPLKYTFLTDDSLRRRGARSKAELIYASNNKGLFSVPIVSEKVRMLFQDRGVDIRYNHIMTGIDIGKKTVRYRTPDGSVDIPYDFINIVPPMRAPEIIRNSPLPWREGNWAEEGWMEVSRDTLRHVRFPKIFGVGDIAGVPKGKTAASIKWQVPVMVDHIVAEIKGEESSSRYNGYTSCPLITQYGRAMLVEFDYNDNLTPSFPGVIAPLEELWITWVMKTIALKPTYKAMLHGQA